MDSGITESLRALLSHVVDYAGLFPPAGLPMPIVAERYQRHISSPEAWMLNRIVLPAERLAEAPIGDTWRITLLVDGEPGPLPPQVETLETKSAGRLSLPTYCEAPIETIRGAFAKLRTGGLTPDAIPSAHHLADWLCRAAALRLPFKATAGLHHPLRSLRPLTYKPDSPRAVMHGFLNVFVAAAFAWQGAPAAQVAEVLEETAADAFRFGNDDLQWRGHSLAVAQIESARRDFAHSFGSCSFEEPVSALRDLKFIP